MADLYYSNVVLNQTIDMVTKGLRDLRSSNLTPFWDQPDPISETQATASYNAVASEMEENGLDAVSRPSFMSQLSRMNGSQLFISFMGDSGINLSEDVDDLVETAVEDPLPDLGGVTTFLRSLSSDEVTLDIARIRELADLLDIPHSPATTKHLTVANPVVYGELEPIIARRISRMREYVRSYFRG